MKKKAAEKQRFLLFYRAQAKVAEAFFMVSCFCELLRHPKTFSDA